MMGWELDFAVPGCGLMKPAQRPMAMSDRLENVAR
jgi:hypothetical protein